MKSVMGTIIIFIGLSIIIYSGILGFLAQESVFIFAVSAIVVMLIIAVVVLGSPFKKRGDYHDDKKDKHLD